MAFEDFCAGNDLETVGAVGETCAVEAVVWVAFDGFLGGREGLFAVFVCKYQGIVFGRLRSDRTCSGIPSRTGATGVHL